MKTSPKIRITLLAILSLDLALAQGSELPTDSSDANFNELAFFTGRQDAVASAAYEPLDPDWANAISLRDLIEPLTSGLADRNDAGADPAKAMLRALNQESRGIPQQPSAPYPWVFAPHSLITIAVSESAARDTRQAPERVKAKSKR